MLTEIYVEALLVDEDLADQVWEAWDKGEIDDMGAFWVVCSDECREAYEFGLLILGAPIPGQDRKH